MKSIFKVALALLPLVLAAGCSQLPFMSGKDTAADTSSLTPEQRDARERQQLYLGRALRNNEHTGSLPRSEPMGMEPPIGGGSSGGD